jgi:hypothetical protein
LPWCVTEIFNIYTLQNQLNITHLAPLRAAAGTGESVNTKVGALLTKDELDTVEKDWVKWRKEWQSRKNIYKK